MILIHKFGGGWNPPFFRWIFFDPNPCKAMGTPMSITKDMGKEKGDESIADCTCLIFAPILILLKEISNFCILLLIFIWSLCTNCPINCLRIISSTEWCRILRQLGGWSCESDFYPNITGLEQVNGHTSGVWRNWILKVGENWCSKKCGKTDSSGITPKNITKQERPAMGTVLVKTWTAMAVMVENPWHRENLDKGFE